MTKRHDEAQRHDGLPYMPCHVLLERQRRRRPANARRPGPKPGSARKAPLHGPPKPITLYVPEMLDLERYPPDLRWPIAYLADRIHRGRVWRWKWVEADGYTRLKWKYLAKVVTGRSLRTVRRRLIDDGVIECDFAAVAGSKAYGYRLAPGYRQTRAAVCTDDAFARRVRQLYDARQQELQPEHRPLLAWLRRVDIDLKRAAAIIRRLPLPRKKRKERYTAAQYRRELWTLCEIIADREHAVIVDRYGRCHSLITRLKNELLCCLSVGGRPIAWMDLSNSQPLMIGLLALRWYTASSMTQSRMRSATFNAKRAYSATDKALGARQDAIPPLSAHVIGHKRHDITGARPRRRYQPPLPGNCPPKPMARKGLHKGVPVTPPADLVCYVDECERGRFYGSLMAAAEKRRAARDPKWAKAFKQRHKRRILTVLYRSNKKGRFANLMAPRMRAKYPSVMAMIEALKRHDYRHAARLAQNYEATIFIKRICGRLAKEHPGIPIYTKHDSIGTTPENVGAVLAVMEQEFGKLGIRPYFKTEDHA
jgi:hypothetical protein